MKKVSLLFPGQGSQYSGMAKNISRIYPESKKIYQGASEVLGFDLYKLCEEDNQDELIKTENQQPAILATSYAYYQFFMQAYGIKPAFLAGHSLGEISALTCAGAIDFCDAIRIVRKRGELMRDTVIGRETCMIAVTNMQREYIEELCKNASQNGEIAVVSNYNSPKQLVISGTKTAVDEVQKEIGDKGGRVVPLKVSAPFHSPLMNDAADKFAEFLKQFTFHDLQYPVLSDVTSLPYKNKEDIIENLRQQMVKPVEWQKIMMYLESEGVDTTIELGPKQVLKKLSLANVDSIEAYAFDQLKDRTDLTEQILGKGKSIELLPMLFVTRCMAHAVCTKNINWDDMEYQSGVIEPYRKVKSMQEQLEEQGKEPTEEQMREALQMLLSVFKTKKVAEDEQRNRIKNLFDETGARNIFSDFQI